MNEITNKELIDEVKFLKKQLQIEIGLMILEIWEKKLDRVLNSKNDQFENSF